MGSGRGGRSRGVILRKKNDLHLERIAAENARRNDILLGFLALAALAAALLALFVL